MKKLLIAGLATLVLAACGGGSSGSKDVSPTERFIGDYSLCNGKFVETFVSIRPSDGNSFTVKELQVVYANADCSGTKTGWVDFKAPSQFTYKTKYSAYTVFGLVGPAEWSTADVVAGTLTVIGQTPVITGSATVGQVPGCLKVGTRVECPPVFDTFVADDIGYVLSNGVLYTGYLSSKAGSSYFDLTQLGIKR